MRKNPYKDWFNSRGHDFVEIGGIKWATCNLGAENPWEPGLYFQWGDTRGYTMEEIVSGRRYFDWNSYKYGNLYNGFKYNESDNLKMLLPEDDAVHVAWGGKWRMPTSDEFKSLILASTIKLVGSYKSHDVLGYVIQDRGDESREIFVPLQGYACDIQVSCQKVYCFLWSSTIAERQTHQGLCMSFHNKHDGLGVNRAFGFPIRGVLDC